tara:strand:- start:9960 stop:10280 length:321 start_codon:yes stop_codon:yes gene_type:complete
MTFAECLGVIAPVYNLVLVVLVLFLFKRLLHIHYSVHHVQTFTKPWRLLAFAVWVFVIEEFFTVLRHADIFHLPLFFNGIFELTILGLFVYALFEQREHLKAVYEK